MNYLQRQINTAYNRFLGKLKFHRLLNLENPSYRLRDKQIIINSKLPQDYLFLPTKAYFIYLAFVVIWE